MEVQPIHCTECRMEELYCCMHTLRVHDGSVKLEAGLSSGIAMYGPSTKKLQIFAGFCTI